MAQAQHALTEPVGASDEPAQPNVELVDRVLYFLPRDVLVPLSAGNDEVFGWRNLFVHGLLLQVRYSASEV